MANPEPRQWDEGPWSPPLAPPYVEDLLVSRGAYRARLDATEVEIAAAQRLRYLCFRDPSDRTGRRDVDAFDPLCQHLIVEDRRDNRVVAACRLTVCRDLTAVRNSYSGRTYDLEPIGADLCPAMEIGRFCLAPGPDDSDVLRLAWGALTRIGLRDGVRFLFGCSSFPGVDAAAHRAALGLLARGHLAPEPLRPRPSAAERIDMSPPGPEFDARAGLAGLPPLLRSYLAMGGWVSDHAVIDRDLNTLHVFTGVEVARIPPARLRALRALAA